MSPLNARMKSTSLSFRRSGSSIAPPPLLMQRDKNMTLEKISASGERNLSGLRRERGANGPRLRAAKYPQAAAMFEKHA